MNLQELRDKSIEDLHTLLRDKKNTLRELSFKASEMQLSEVRKIRETKKDIARILTVITEHSNQSAS